MHLFLHVGLPLYSLLGFSLSLLGFVRKGFLLSVLASLNGYLWICCCFSCKTGQNAVRFCFLLFDWVRFVLGSRPKKGTENRTERTLDCSGRNSVPPFPWFFASPNGQFRTARVRSCVTVGFYGFSFSEGSVLHHKFRQTTRASCQGMLGSGWFFPVSLPPFPLLPLLLWLAAGTGACSCFFRRLDDASSPPLPESSSPQIVWLLFGFFFPLFRPCVVSIKRYRTG